MFTPKNRLQRNFDVLCLRHFRSIAACVYLFRNLMRNHNEGKNYTIMFIKERILGRMGGLIELLLAIRCEASEKKGAARALALATDCSVHELQMHTLLPLHRSKNNEL